MPKHRGTRDHGSAVLSQSGALAMQYIRTAVPAKCSTFDKQYIRNAALSQCNTLAMQSLAMKPMFGYQLVSANKPPGKSEDRVSCLATSTSIPPEPPSKPSLAWSLASQPRTPSTQIPCLVASNEGQLRYQLRSCGARCRPRQCPPTLLETTATTPHGQSRFRRAVIS